MNSPWGSAPLRLHVKTTGQSSKLKKESLENENLFLVANKLWQEPITRGLQLP